MPGRPLRRHRLRREEEVRRRLPQGLYRALRLRERERERFLLALVCLSPSIEMCVRRFTSTHATQKKKTKADQPVSNYQLPGNKKKGRASLRAALNAAAAAEAQPPLCSATLMSLSLFLSQGKRTLTRRRPFPPTHTAPPFLPLPFFSPAASSTYSTPLSSGWSPSRRSRRLSSRPWRSTGRRG